MHRNGKTIFCRPQSIPSILSILSILLILPPTRTPAADSWPSPEWKTAEPREMGMDAALLRQARDYALKAGGSGHVIRRGRLVMAWGDPKKRYDLKSTTKAIGVTALGLALDDGKVQSLDDKARDYHPGFGVPPESNAKTGWLDRVTLFHLATQTAGFDKKGGYTEILFEPGTKWSYSDGGPNWLAECLTLQYGRDLNDLMFERVFTPIGIKPSDLRWRNNSYRAHEINGVARREFGSGISANVDAMARIGYLYLHKGSWRGREIIPPSFVDAVRVVPPSVRGLPVLMKEKYHNASDHYGLHWWNNADGTLAGVPRDAYWSWGLYDSLIVVIPSLDLAVARAGKSFKPGRSSDYNVILGPFLGPIAKSVKKEKRDRAPCPPSPVVESLQWDPPSKIVRKASGSDNWPMTWADDGHLYTAYGDGWGFEPKVPEKLSLGFARVEGPAGDFRGVNIRSVSGETKGGGAKGKKASGLLALDGVLYMWVRNAGNSQLARSADRGKTWTWSDWKFTESFGCPTFLNFGKNYAGARDEYVYAYSFDSDSAYEPADRMVLARVPKNRVGNRESYDFFQKLDKNGKPVWTKDVDRRGSVFDRKGKCYRSNVSYNAPLKRYFWAQTPGGDTRFKGGLGVFDAPEPWGPWTTVFFTDEWDAGPGESAGFPTKWISEDGKTMYLVFSGDDHFSVRKAKVTLRNAR